MKEVIQVIDTVDKLRAIIPLLEQESVLAYDLETTGLDPKKDKVLLAAIATNRYMAYVVDFTLIPITEFRLLAPLLTSKDILKLGFNFAFDWKMTYGNTGCCIDHMFDCMLAEQCITAGLYVAPVKGKQFSLEAVSHRRLQVAMDKSIRNRFIGYIGKGFELEEYYYAAFDTMLLFDIYEQQLKEIAQHSLEQVIKLEMDLIPCTGLMEYTGVEIDKAEMESLVAPFIRYVNACYTALQDAFIQNGAADEILVSRDGYMCVNPNSKPNKKTGSKGQMLEALHIMNITVRSLSAKDILKWDFYNSGRKKEIPFLDLLEDEDLADALEKYGRLNNHYLRLYAFYIGAEKLLSSYVLGKLEKIQPDSRYYGWFKQLGARSTGRYSSDMQQWPKDTKLDDLGLQGYSIRRCIKAGKGKKLIIADFSAIELVIIADRSGDEKLAYEHMHGDVHVVVANISLGAFFKEARELTKQNKKEFPYSIVRDASKVISYGIAYGVGGKSLAEQMTLKLGALGLTVTPEQGDEMIALWKEQAFPDAGEFLTRMANQAVTLGYTESSYGRKRFWNLDDLATNLWRYYAAQREGSNQGIQSTSADMTKLAMLYCYQKLDRTLAQIIITVHDEIVIEAVETYADTAAAILKESMERAARVLLPKLGHTVFVETAISDCYDK